MKKFLFNISLLLILLSSCQQENYDLEITGTEPVLVVDGRVMSHTQRASVNLSLTTDFFGDQPKNVVEDALVFIDIDGAGETQLTYIGSGNYELTGVKVDEGTTYDLRIDYNGKDYTASTEMMNTLQISNFILEETSGFGGDSLGPTYNFNMILNIDLSSTDYYITETYLYDSVTSTFTDRSYLPWDDEAYATNPALFPFFVEDYYPGDSLKVNFSHINENTYDFYNSLISVGSQNPSSLAPANPISNISQGAIGNFGAYATYEKLFVLKP